MKILITGSAGFIGSNLCEFFLKKNFDVIGLDNFSTGHYKNIAHIVDNTNFTFIDGDIRDFNVCQEVTKYVDVVLHQAALGSVPRSIKDPRTTNDVNVSGFLNIMEASRQNGVERFIYASSSSNYGDSVKLPKIEDQIGNPLSPYAVTKYTNEIYASVYYREFGLKTIGLRYFNVFGRRQDPNGPYAAVIPKFIGQLLKGERPTINGDGSNSRDFTYIENVIQMNYLALTSSNPKAFNQVYNTAFGHRVSILEMANLMIKELQKRVPDLKDIKVKFGPERRGDVKHSQANIEKAKNLLGYSPTHSFKEGLLASLDWYIKNL